MYMASLPEVLHAMCKIGIWRVFGVYFKRTNFELVKIITV